MPTQASRFTQPTLPKEQLEALQCDQNRALPGRSPALSGLFGGSAGRPIPEIPRRRRCHKPETCLVASGRKMEANLGLRWYDVGDLKLPFRRLVFENAPQPLYVFFCLWQDGTERFPHLDNVSIAGRLSAALNGRRMLGQQTLEIICTGYNSFEEAEAAVTARLPDLIKIERAVRSQ